MERSGRSRRGQRSDRRERNGRGKAVWISEVTKLLQQLYFSI